MNPIDGRRILVTGASAGIGEAIAREAIARGATVAGLSRREDRLRQIEGLVAVSADVRVPDEAADAVESAASATGGLDALVNAAGLNRPGIVETGLPSDWRDLFETNVLGLLAVTKAAIPHLRAGHNPTIVNISSNSSRRVISAQNGVYAATKHAVRAISEALRLELAGTVRVTDVAPGYVRDTEIHGSYRDAAHKAESDERQARFGIDRDHFAALVVDIIAQPGDVQVEEILVTRPGPPSTPYRH